MWKRILIIAVSILLLGCLIYFSGIDKILNVIGNFNIFYFLLSIGVLAISLLIRVYRWKYLLNKANINVGFVSLIPVYAGGMLASSLTPGKIGDPLRSVLLKKVHDFNIENSLPSIFFERIFDIITIFLISCFSILFLTSLGSFSIFIILALIIYGVVFGTGIFVIISERRTVSFFKLFHRIFSFLKFIKKIEYKVEDFSRNLSNSFSVYKNWRICVITFLISFIEWTLEGVFLWSVLNSFGSSMNMFHLILVVPLISLISVLTFLPGGLGSSEAISAVIITSISNLTLAEITVAAIFSRILFYIFYGIIGSFSASKLYKK